MKRIALAAALAAATATPLAAFDMSSMSEEERAAFRAEIRAYLMDNPEVLLEAIDVLERRQADQQAQDDLALVATNAGDLFDDGHSWVGGNPDGDITIVEFLDYRCGYCRRAHPDVAELVASDGNIRYIVKEFPILGEDSVLASRFAISVKEIEGDAAYQDVLNELMTMPGNLTEASLSDLSELMGFDTDKVFDTMDSDLVSGIIAENRALAQRLQINGTPSFVFDDEMVRGYVPLEGMRAIVADKRADM